MNKILKIIESRLLWVLLTYIILFVVTGFLVLLGFGIFGKENNWIKYGVLFPTALIISVYAIVTFRYSIVKEFMLWQGYAIYVMPISLIVMVVGYKIFGNVEFILSIFGLCIAWPLIRWFHDSIPD